VKAKFLRIVFSFSLLPSLCAFGQVDCTTSTKLVCEVPAAAGVIATAAVGNSSGSVTAAKNAVAPISQAINSAIGSQLTQLPIPSASAGTVSLKQEGSPLGIPYTNLGPILTDRADTIGRHEIFAGFSYQHFNFNAIDGIDLNQLNIGITFQQTFTGIGGVSDTQTIYGTSQTAISFKVDQYVGLLTYGLTRTTDVSVVVPFPQITLNSTTFNPKTYVYDANAGQYINETRPGTFPTRGSSDGVGDVILRVKQSLLGWEGRRPAISAGADLRLPSGDALNYLGSGAYGVNVYGLFEYRRRVTPRLKFGYQWNGASQLVNINAPSSSRLPGGLQYDAGADYSLNRHLTFAADVLGSQYVNSASIFNSQLNITTPNPSNVPTLAAVASTPKTYTSANFSGGAKLYLGRHWIFYGNVLVALNNVGLRSDPVPLGGVSFRK
jgi:Putative MetA-pathway of phenol degradation